ncbi:MAG: cellulose biosynthesis protein BcsN [Pseudomonadota bacterium]
MASVFRRPWVRALSTSILLLAVSGCVRVSFENTSSIVDDGPVRNGLGYTIVENVSPDEAFVKFDALVGRTISMDERHYGQGIEQRLVFAADPNIIGENMVETRIVNRSSFTNSDEKLELHETDAVKLRADFKRAFPGRRFAVDPSVHYNDYGSFGFAFFTPRSGQGCVYGWQNLEATATDTRNTRYVVNWLRDRTTSGHNAKLSFRLRYCATGMKWQDALEMMRRARIDVPADVFRRDRRLRWSSGPTYNSGGGDTRAQDLNYVTTPPYEEQRGTLCPPGTSLDNIGGFASSCAPEEPKPTVRSVPVRKKQTVVRRAPAPKPKPQQVAPVRPQIDPNVAPIVPLPVTPTQPINPDVPMVRNSPSVTTVPVIQPNQPVIHRGQDRRDNGTTTPSIMAVPNGTTVNAAPGIVPLPQATPRMQPLVQPRAVGGQGVRTIVAPSQGVGDQPVRPTPRVISLTEKPLVSVGQEERATRSTAQPQTVECNGANNHLPQCRGQ